MKPTTAFRKEYQQLATTLEKVPVIQECSWVQDKPDGFIATLLFTDETRVPLDSTLLSRAYPSIIYRISQEILQKNGNESTFYPIIMAPYISDEAAKECERQGIGYLDYSGNCRIVIHSLYVSKQGHPNKFVTKHKAKTLFNPSAKVSSLILREVMRDISVPWKLSKLSQKVGCSIGQVSKVKEYLCEQRWAQMSPEGMRIIDAQSLMKSWSNAYSQKAKDFEILGFHTIMPIPEFEESLRVIRKNLGIDAALTGIAGGVRYAPLVRYNKLHILLLDKDMDTFLEATSCKKVASGANVQIQTISSEEMLYDSKEIRGQLVASPVQVYLDCMRGQSRGEEIAEAVLNKEIERYER